MSHKNLSYSKYKGTWQRLLNKRALCMCVYVNMTIKSIEGNRRVDKYVHMSERETEKTKFLAKHLFTFNQKKKKKIWKNCVYICTRILIPIPYWHGIELVFVYFKMVSYSEKFYTHLCSH